MAKLKKFLFVLLFIGACKPRAPIASEASNNPGVATSIDFIDAEFVVASITDVSEQESFLKDDEELALAGNLRDVFANMFGRKKPLSFTKLEDLKKQGIHAAVVNPHLPVTRGYEYESVQINVMNLYGKNPESILPLFAINARRLTIRVYGDVPSDFNAAAFQDLKERFAAIPLTGKQKTVVIEFPEYVSIPKKVMNVLKESEIPHHWSAKTSITNGKRENILIIKRQKISNLYERYISKKDEFFPPITDLEDTSKVVKSSSSDSSASRSTASSISTNASPAVSMQRKKLFGYKISSGPEPMLQLQPKGNLTDELFWNKVGYENTQPLGERPRVGLGGAKYLANRYFVTVLDGKKYFLKSIDARFGTHEFEMAQLVRESPYAVRCEGIKADKDGEARNILAFEFAEGDNVASVLSKIGAIDLKKSQENIRGLADYLEILHKKGYAFNDWKTDNLIRGTDGKMRVVDTEMISKFGDRTPTGADTPFYVPKDARRDGSNDLYAFTVTAAEMATGKNVIQLYDDIAKRMGIEGMNDLLRQMVHTFDFSIVAGRANMPNPTKTWQQAMDEYFDDLVKSNVIPKDQGEFFKKGMHTDPEKRFKNIDELKENLGQVLGSA